MKCPAAFRFGIVLIAFATHATFAADATPNIRDLEETYELRLERVMNAKGKQALAEFLAKELAERPRPYVKAWYANLLLYGEEFGLKDIVDVKRGWALAKESRAEGSLFGLELVGRCWGDGRGPGFRDSKEAARCLHEAAEAGRDSAMSEIGKYYFFGFGVKPDRAIAEEWMRKAAYRGATGGIVMLAQWWENPQYGTPDPAKALALYFEAGQFGSDWARGVIAERAKKGDREAQKYLHLDFIIGAMEGADPLPSKLKEAVKWLEANAAPDDWRVQVALADVMKQKAWPEYDIARSGGTPMNVARGEMGQSWPVYNLAAAEEKLARAIAAGNDDAREIEAEMLWRGIGRKADPAAAIARWQELAEKGNSRALNKLGWLYWWGNGERFGLPKDEHKAFELCSRSAVSGFWAGQFNLADCYAHGIGTPVNYHQAAQYYDILAKRGYRRGREMRERILGYLKD